MNFLLLLLVFTGTGAALWHGWIEGRLAVLVFVVAGWVVSLCLHEFGHAIVAYLGGDWTVADTGYLTLDPLKYTDPVLSLVMPILYIFLGGFGLPGGAVYIRTSLLRSAGWDSAVSAAGPFATFLFLVLLAVLGAVAPAGADGDISDIQAALGALAFFQASALVLNLVPFPGLDGFGIIRPFLPHHVAAATAMAGTSGFLILALLIWFTPLGGLIFSASLALTDAFGISRAMVGHGFGMIRL